MAFQWQSTMDRTVIVNERDHLRTGRSSSAAAKYAFVSGLEPVAPSLACPSSGSRWHARSHGSHAPRRSPLGSNQWRLQWLAPCLLLARRSGQFACITRGATTPGMTRGPQHPLHEARCLPQRQAEQHLDCRASLDGGVAVDQLCAALAGQRRMPRRRRVAPDGRRSAHAQRSVVAGPAQGAVAARCRPGHAARPWRRTRHVKPGGGFVQQRRVRGNERQQCPQVGPARLAGALKNIRRFDISDNIALSRPALSSCSACTQFP
ncbi:hypothetical protein ROA7023_02978 [Roseisalinus antarcticus]|uniref:Uncharacterized protein n=1 Tax=Roseisalinus antarcticus TaxID=254357 RepID=A0A1Y5TK48_9RHOB|nr:hypothetical protein ROA7023_02978 [Roseisalinus antarcticus]